MLRQLAVCVVNLQTMHNPPDILSLAYRQSVLQDQFVMLQEKVRLIPGSVQYTINRYHNTGNWNM